MFRVVLALVSILSIAAFAPVTRVARQSSLKMGFESEIGVQKPLGFWDPFNFLADADQARFDRLRTVETKHGRIAMAAILGEYIFSRVVYFYVIANVIIFIQGHMVTTAGYRLPGDISPGVPFASIKAGLAAFDGIPSYGVVQIVAFIGKITILLKLY